MAYGSALVDTISSSGNLAITGNVTTSGTLQPSALKGLSANAPPLFQDSAGIQIGTLSRAWFQTTLTAGTPGTINGFNVSSVTYVSTGNWDVNLTVPMTTTDTLTGFITSDGNYNITYAIIKGSSTTSKIRIWCKTNANVFYNPGVLYVGFFW